MINIVFFIRHSPPSEVELLPGSDVSSSSGESVVGLRSVEVLAHVLSVVPVGDASSNDCEV